MKVIALPTNNHLEARTSLVPLVPSQPQYEEYESVRATEKPFILANTLPMTVEAMAQEHIIPVFIKDNEPLISHVDFIEVVQGAVTKFFHGEPILAPAVRVSHPIKGRIPEARHKPAKELKKNEETLYYERCAFVVELPRITRQVDDQTLTLTVGGVKAYNADNIYNRKGAEEHFKVFIGFENRVCTNLCVWSDGYAQDVRVRNLKELLKAVTRLLSEFSLERQVEALERFNEVTLSEEQFARLIGRGRMYQFLPNAMRKEMPKLLFPDTHLSAIVRDYYQDASFCRMEDGNISLWRLYNLFTGANKQSYIDTFVDRSVNAFEFVQGIQTALQGERYNWFLS